MIKNEKKPPHSAIYRKRIDMLLNVGYNMLQEK